MGSPVNGVLGATVSGGQGPPVKTNSVAQTISKLETGDISRSLLGGRHSYFDPDNRLEAK
jgi:hypothetical protein